MVYQCIGVCLGVHQNSAHIGQRWVVRPSLCSIDHLSLCCLLVGSGCAINHLTLPLVSREFKVVTALFALRAQTYTYKGRQRIHFLMPGFTTANVDLAERYNHSNLSPQITYSVTDISFNSQEYFYRSLPSDAATNDARSKLLDMFQWYRVGLLTSSDTYYAKVRVKHD